MDKQVAFGGLKKLQFSDISAAAGRIQPYILRTPLVESLTMNALFPTHRLFFKMECLQKVQAFKARGAMNTLLHLKEQDALPEKVVACSSGNHAQGVAWAAKQLGLSATLFIAQNASRLKIEATRQWGATVVIAESREVADLQAKRFAETEGAYLISPFDHDDVISGQGTATMEAYQQEQGFTAVFAPCGGGGLLSGTVIASRHFDPGVKVFGAEPEIANDAATSLRLGHIVPLGHPATTIADGVRTPMISERTFQYLKEATGIIEVSEQAIKDWTLRLNEGLRTHLPADNSVFIETTCGLTMAAVAEWLVLQTTPQKVLVIISGGNTDLETQLQLMP